MRKASQEVRLGLLTTVRVLSLDPGALAAVRWLAEERGRACLVFPQWELRLSSSFWSCEEVNLFWIPLDCALHFEISKGFHLSYLAALLLWSVLLKCMVHWEQIWSRSFVMGHSFLQSPLWGFYNIEWWDMGFHIRDFQCLKRWVIEPRLYGFVVLDGIRSTGPHSPFLIESQINNRSW